MNPGWILLADPTRGDRMWHDIVKTEHDEDGWKLTASCGRELVTQLAGEGRADPPADGIVCRECAEAAATAH
jgi:hypothetical protein